MSLRCQERIKNSTLQCRAMSPCITKHRENKYVQEDMRSYPLIHNFIPALKELGELPDPYVASEGEDRGK